MFSVLACFIWNQLIAISQEAGIYADHEDLRGTFSQLHKIVAFHIPSSPVQEGIRESLLQMGIRHFRPKLNTEPFYPAGTFTLVCRVPEALAKNPLHLLIFWEGSDSTRSAIWEVGRGTHSIASKPSLPGWFENRAEVVLPIFFVIAWGETIHQGSSRKMFCWTLSSGRGFASICLSSGKC